MKKSVLILLAAALLLCTGCAGAVPAATVPETVAETTAPAETAPETVPETTEETIPVPELVYGTAQVDETPAVLMLLSAGDTVDVVDEYDERHFVVKTEDGYGLVEKPLVRTAEAEAFETRTGYARYKTELHDDLRLSGEPVQVLKTNAKLEILEDLGWCYLVRWEDTVGYVATGNVSNSPIKGGGGGGNSSGGADGGDISLRGSWGLDLLTMVAQEGDVTGQATVLADNTPVILGYFDRGDTLPIVAEEGFAEEWEGYFTVYLEGLYAWVPRELSRMEGDETYEQWTGYSKYKADLFGDRWLLDAEPERLSTNTQVNVLLELEDSFLVEIEGKLGYMDKEMVSKHRNSSGGGGGNGSGGEWTPPAM